ncbi:MAG: hypothetical protein JWQ42_3537 [Edaphobacter sp.]|nr:hypothetical protein [Edaphobacter sp.]
MLPTSAPLLAEKTALTRKVLSARQNGEKAIGTSIFRVAPAEMFPIGSGGGSTTAALQPELADRREGEAVDARILCRSSSGVDEGKLPDAEKV